MKMMNPKLINVSWRGLQLLQNNHRELKAEYRRIRKDILRDYELRDAIDLEREISIDPGKHIFVSRYHQDVRTIDRMAYEVRWEMERRKQLVGFM